LPRLIFEIPTEADYDWISVIFGIGMVAGSAFVDRIQSVRKLQKDYAFWGYIYGVAALFGGLIDLRYYVYENSDAFRWIFLISNLALCSGSVIFQRNVFIVFGGLGASSAIVDFFVNEATIEENAWVSVSFGTILIVAGILAQKKNAMSNFPFWAFLFGSSIFFCGTSTLFGYPIYSGELFKFLFFLSNVGLCLLTLYTQYRIFFIYGVFGGLWYIQEIVYVHYWNSYWLPLILTAIGLAIIALAAYLSNHWNNKKKKMEESNHIEMKEPLLYYYPMASPYNFPVTFVGGYTQGEF